MLVIFIHVYLSHKLKQTAVMSYAASVPALFLLLSLFSPVLSQSDCSQPSQSVLVAHLTDLLLNEDGSLTYSPTLIGSVHYVCQAQGSSRGTYRSLSIIATYTPNTGQSQTTSIFQLLCNSGLWEANLSGGLPAPVAGLINTPTRTDCSQCSYSFGDDRCRGKCTFMYVLDYLIIL